MRYFTETLARDEYFFSPGAAPGRWHGRLARALGLPDVVTKSDFAALARNRHPVTGEKLTVRDAAQRRTSIDYTFGAPKSVSLVLALNGDQDVLYAHRAAVQKAMAEIECDMRTQITAGERKSYQCTGNIVYARFDHVTARPVRAGETCVPDPHLHSHCVVMNCTRYRGRYQALEGSVIHRTAAYYQNVYRSTLARTLQRLGYPIIRTKDAFEIAGFPYGLRQKFSRRTQEIEALAEALAITDPKKKAALGAYSRAHKTAGTRTEDVVRVWKARLTPGEISALRTAKSGASSGSTLTPAAAIARALDHHLERRSTVPVKTLLATALSLTYGSAEIETLIAALRERGDILTRQIRHLDYLTTRAALRDENNMLDYAATTRNTVAALHPTYRIKRDFLNDGQKRAVRQVLRARDRITIISGGAGTGKTTLLRELKQAAEERGRRIYAFAPSASASRDVLRAKGFAGADTIARLLARPAMQNRTRGQIILIDEAGMVGVRTMNKIFETARKQNARVILSGDHRQHSSVEAGDALRLLQTAVALPVARVDEIVRQSDPSYKHAVGLLAQGRIRDGFMALDKRGAVREIDDRDERYRAVAADYVRSLEQGRSAMIISPTHREGVRITAAVRDALKTRERIRGAERHVKTRISAGFTAAQKQDPALFEPGMAVIFHRTVKGGFSAGTVYEIQNTTMEGRVIVCDKRSNKEQIVPLSHARYFDVFHQGELSLAAGDVIRITANGRTLGGRRIYNGQLYTVTGFTPAGHIALSTGDVLDKTFAHITYGYCQTSHSAQGRDCQDIFIAQSAMSFPASNRKQFYVSASRATDRITIYTDDKRALLKAVSHTGNRMTATEVFNRIICEPINSELFKTESISRWKLDI